MRANFFHALCMAGEVVANVSSAGDIVLELKSFSADEKQGGLRAQFELP